MEVISNLTISNETVTLDDKHFRDCTLDNCELTYEGGPVILERTHIRSCEYAFGGKAQRTVELLKVVGILGSTVSAEYGMAEMIN